MTKSVITKSLEIHQWKLKKYVIIVLLTRHDTRLVGGEPRSEDGIHATGNGRVCASVAARKFHAASLNETNPSFCHQFIPLHSRTIVYQCGNFVCTSAYCMVQGEH